MQAAQVPMTEFLGAARVVRIDGARLLLMMNETQAWASNAIAYPYDFQVDDMVLAIGQKDDWFVIGVLQGSGKTTLHVPGNLQLMAPNGSIEMVASRGVSIRSPTVNIVATQLNLAAKKLNERFEQARLWVKESYEIMTKRMTTRAEGSYRLNADKIVERAKGDVKIDGKKIHLG
ncbi:DUF3540 domain-containing protein [Aureliella helgolandensis]|uniref:DUF3540 domain-containing protein n=1 Tax=Aureliella helgolandensis TaxID=2527968 RepID=A0A518GAK1_9BACT|nr:DUF3540 domain-containing protein [Aureliella helgolandensis]QDV25614.1 hypothetical protein Q31a_39400 [Aureliella helgolandensis]